MTTIQITPALKVTMLKHLVAGRDLDFVATATHTPRDRVLDIVSKHGYPDVERMKWAIDILAKDGDQIPEREPVVDHRPRVLLDEPPPAALAHAQSAERRNSLALTPPAPTGNMTRPVHTSASQLLHQAGESDRSRTRALAAKISTLLADLTARLADETAAAEAQVQAAKENAAVTARIATLQAEIDKLKGKRAKTTTGIVSTPKESSTTGELYLCQREGCDRSFTTVQGVHLHRRRAHEGMSAVKAAS